MNEDSNNKENSAYTKMAGEIYDQIYSSKDYQSESGRIKEIVKRFKLTDGNLLLDVGCGTCGHWQYLTDSFKLEGIDKSEPMVAVGLKKLPSAKIVIGDMLDFKMDKDYDVVTCLFGGIGYMSDLKSLNQAVLNMADHLKPGGVLILEASNCNRDTYQTNGVFAVFVDKPDIKISRMSVSPEPSEDGKICLELHHLVATKQGVDYFVEEHIQALHSFEDLKQAILAANLKIEPETEELGSGSQLLVATKPVNS